MNDNIPATSDAPAASQPDVSAQAPTSSGTESSRTEAQSEYRVPGTNKTMSIPQKKDTRTEGGADPVSQSAKSPTPKQTNAQNAQRRVQQQNQKLKAKIAELEQRIASLDPNKPDEYLEASALTQEANTYSTIVQSAEDDSFQAQAEEVFGADTPKFMEDTYRYAKHVNANEPEVKSYINAPYGMYVLKAWYDRMNVPHLREQWLSMNGYQKGKVLDLFHTQIEQAMAGQHAPAAPPQQQSVPAAKGGRVANGTAPMDDFALALQEARNRYGVK